MSAVTLARCGVALTCDFCDTQAPRHDNPIDPNRPIKDQLDEHAREVGWRVDREPDEAQGTAYCPDCRTMHAPPERRMCPVTNCRKGILGTQLMCARHWKMVPRELQRRVQAAWKARCAAVRTSGYKTAAAAHEEHKRQAIAWVNDKLAASAAAEET